MRQLCGRGLVGALNSVDRSVTNHNRPSHDNGLMVSCVNDNGLILSMNKSLTIYRVWLSSLDAVTAAGLDWTASSALIDWSSCRQYVPTSSLFPWCVRTSRHVTSRHDDSSYDTTSQSQSVAFAHFITTLH